LKTDAQSRQAAVSIQVSGTDVRLRRALVSLPANESTSARTRVYVSHYLSVLASHQLVLIHLSKSGGTGLCSLSMVNGCFRAGAGQSPFTTNCQL